MKKYLLGLTTAAILCSPFVYADDTMGQDPQTAPTTTDSMPSTPTTTTTTTTTPSTNTTSTSDTTTTTDVQLKTLDGKIIHVQIDPQDLQGMSVGDKLEVTDLGTSNTSSGASTTGTSNPGTTNNTNGTTNGNGNISQ